MTVDSRAIIEAMLFVAEEPLATGEIAEVLEVPKSEVEVELAGLATSLQERAAGVVLRQLLAGGGSTAIPMPIPTWERFAATEKATRLSSAALETLAVVAYRQPVLRGEVAEIRGVDSEQALRTLERRGLVAEVGKAAGSGAALLYGTTALFLEKLGIDGHGDLPPIADHVPPVEVVETLERPFRPDVPSNGA